MRLHRLVVGGWLGVIFACLVAACQAGTDLTAAPINRQDRIPAAAEKITPLNDPQPPRLLLPGYEQPVPLPGAVNTAGAEDSPFILPDGNTLYFFFTPDLHIPAEQQLTDGVTGLYVARRQGEQWGEAQRIWLQDPSRLALDGCEFVLGERIWFCSAREGYAGVQWFTARLQEGAWRDWQPADFPPEYQVGELHLSADESQLYFHSARPGGKGGLDIWLCERVEGGWGEPVNLEAINTEGDEGYPALSPDGQELWFSRNYGIWRSRKLNGAWQSPEQVVANLAGEPSLDRAGNLYFVHHFLQDGEIIEADIYLVRKK